MLDGCTSLFHDFLFHFRQRPGNARPGCKDVTATAKFFANRADIDRVVFRAHAHAHFSIWQFLEENRHDHPAHRAQMIDQPFVVFRDNAEAARTRLAQS